MLAHARAHVRTKNWSESAALGRGGLEEEAETQSTGLLECAVGRHREVPKPETDGIGCGHHTAMHTAAGASPGYDAPGTPGFMVEHTC